MPRLTRATPVSYGVHYRLLPDSRTHGLTRCAIAAGGTPVRHVRTGVEEASWRQVNMSAETVTQDPSGTLNRQYLARVLVVDDERSIRDLLAQVLADEGYDVVTARSGLEALSLLQVSYVDAILLDLSMPVMDGISFRRRQLLQPELAPIPVIVISANYDLVRQGQSLQPYACLSKPFDLVEVIKTLAAACASGY